MSPAGASGRTPRVGGTRRRVLLGRDQFLELRQALQAGEARIGRRGLLEIGTPRIGGVALLAELECHLQCLERLGGLRLRRLRARQVVPYLRAVGHELDQTRQCRFRPRVQAELHVGVRDGEQRAGVHVGARNPVVENGKRLVGVLRLHVRGNQIEGRLEVGAIGSVVLFERA